MTWRLPLLASVSRETNTSEQEQISQRAETTLLLTLRDKFARLRALREELEQKLEEWSERCARLGAWETRLSLSTTQTQQEIIPHQEAFPSVSDPASRLIEGPPSGLIPLWIEGLGVRIRYNATRHVLVIDTTVVTLTPTEFRLVFEVLTRYAQWQTTRQSNPDVLWSTRRPFSRRQGDRLAVMSNGISQTPMPNWHHSECGGRLYADRATHRNARVARSVQQVPR